MKNGNGQNGDLNGKHGSENGNSEYTEKLKKVPTPLTKTCYQIAQSNSSLFLKENVLLRKLLDDERKLNRETQIQKDKIKDLIKIGHEALEHERLEFQGKLDEKV